MRVSFGSVHGLVAIVFAMALVMSACSKQEDMAAEDAASDEVAVMDSDGLEPSEEVEAEVPGDVFAGMSDEEAKQDFEGYLKDRCLQAFSDDAQCDFAAECLVSRFSTKVDMKGMGEVYLTLKQGKEGEGPVWKSYRELGIDCFTEAVTNHSG